MSIAGKVRAVAFVAALALAQAGGVGAFGQNQLRGSQFGVHSR